MQAASPVQRGERLFSSLQLIKLYSWLRVILEQSSFFNLCAILISYCGIAFCDRGGGGCQSHYRQWRRCLLAVGCFGSETIALQTLDLVGSVLSKLQKNFYLNLKSEFGVHRVRRFLKWLWSLVVSPATLAYYA